MKRALVLAALALVGAGCASSTLPSDRKELIRRILESTVQLRSERESGGRRAASGVVLATDPASQRIWILTARHFLDPPQAQKVYVRLPGRDGGVQGEVTLVSDDFDLAIVETEHLAVTPVRLKMVASLGDDVLIVAFPWGQSFTVVRGAVSQVTSPRGDPLVSGPVRMVDASVSYGSSGGGVFDAQSGELVGIVESHRTARVAIPEMKERVLEVPVAGETTVISATTIARFLVGAGLADFLAK